LLQNVNVLHANEAEAKNDRGGEKVTWSGGNAGGSGCGRGGGVGGGCCYNFFFLLLAAFCYLCPSPSFVLFFPVYGLAVVEGGRGSGWKEE
jgi:hypothetical protein